MQVDLIRAVTVEAVVVIVREPVGVSGEQPDFIK